MRDQETFKKLERFLVKNDLVILSEGCITVFDFFNIIKFGYPKAAQSRTFLIENQYSTIENLYLERVTAHKMG